LGNNNISSSSFSVDFFELDRKSERDHQVGLFACAVGEAKKKKKYYVIIQCFLCQVRSVLWVMVLWVSEGKSVPVRK
jgi:hypothetical protein